MLAAEVILPAQSNWASPVLIAAKKYGTLRFCLEYRKINDLTSLDSYPIPGMDDCIDSIGDSTV